MLQRIPNRHCIMGITKTPLEKHYKALNEKYHIYQRNNAEYNNVIKRGLLLCIKDFKNNHNLQKIRKNEDIKYASYNLNNLIKDIPNIILYVGLIDFNDNYINAINITNKEEEIVEGIIPVSKYINNKIEKAAIIVEISKNNIDISEITGIIHHELLHILHKTNSQNMANIAGWAFTYAYQIVELFDLENIPNYENLEIIKNNKILTKFGLLCTLINAMYILDNDELQAWRESFNIVNKNIIKRKVRYNEKLTPEFYKKIREYKTYQYLLECITKYYSELINIQSFLNNSDFDNILKNYFKTCYNIKLKDNYTLKNIIDFKWIPTCKQQLKIFQNLHYYNSNEHTSNN